MVSGFPPTTYDESIVQPNYNINNNAVAKPTNPCLSDVRELGYQIDLIKAGLPRNVVPSVLAVGMTNSAKGTLLVSCFGCVVSVKVQVPKYKMEKKHNNNNDTTPRTTNALDAATSFLLNHLLTSFSFLRADGCRVCSSSVPL